MFYKFKGLIKIKGNKPREQLIVSI